MTDSGWS